MNTKKMGRPKGSGMIEPTPVHRLMMELASSSGDIKYANLRQIGEIVAESIGRKKPFSKQYVKQVMDRWKGYNGWEGYDTFRVTAPMLAKLQSYASGEGKLTTEMNAARQRLNMPKRQNKTTQSFELIARKRAKDWSKGFTLRELGIKWGIPRLSVHIYVNRYRKRFPDLFPRRRK